MFERYTESARRALFFARYEASQLGGRSIETEHLLLGLLRDGQGILRRILDTRQVSLEKVRTELEARFELRESFPTSVEIPFSVETQKVLRDAAEEADRLEHNYVGTEHLLLGLLRQDGSVAASVLAAHGLRLEDTRRQLVELSGGAEAPPETASGDIGARFDRIKYMVRQLGRLSGDEDGQSLAMRIVEELDRLERLVEP
jgi:ATP-dependent Clp protease ATP-binding subunit ClpC